MLGALIAIVVAAGWSFFEGHQETLFALAASDPVGIAPRVGRLAYEMSLRMAVAMPPAVHYYSPCEQCGYADDGPRAFW